MAQITLTQSGGGTLTLETICGTLLQQDNTADQTETFYPRIRRGLGLSGSCSVFLPPDELAEITVRLLAFSANQGEGKLQIKGDGISAVHKALLDVTFLADPPVAKLSWQGMKEN